MMAKLHHPNIVQFLGFAQFYEAGASQLCIVMELFQHRSVRCEPVPPPPLGGVSLSTLSRSPRAERVSPPSRSPRRLRTTSDTTRSRRRAPSPRRRSAASARRPAMAPVAQPPAFPIAEGVKVRRRPRRRPTAPTFAPAGRASRAARRALARCSPRRPLAGGALRARAARRSVQPSNFMLTNWLRVKLCDFGLSRLFERERGAQAGPDAARAARRAGGAPPSAATSTRRQTAAHALWRPGAAEAERAPTVKSRPRPTSSRSASSLVRLRARAPCIGGCRGAGFSPRSGGPAAPRGHAAPARRLDACWATEARARPPRPSSSSGGKPRDASSRMSCGARIFAPGPSRQMK